MWLRPGCRITPSSCFDAVSKHSIDASASATKSSDGRPSAPTTARLDGEYAIWTPRAPARLSTAYRFDAR